MSEELYGLTLVGFLFGIVCAYVVGWERGAAHERKEFRELNDRREADQERKRRSMIDLPHDIEG